MWKPPIIKTNMLEDITEVVFSLDELDNTSNFKTESPSYPLLMYHVTAHEDSMYFESYTLQCRKLNHNQYGGHYDPYSFSSVSPEQLKLTPSNFLTFSFYLLAVRKIYICYF